MAFEEGALLDRAQTAEASLKTAKEQIDRLTEQFQEVLGTLCAKRLGDGTIDIDFEALEKRMAEEHAKQFRDAMSEDNVDYNALAAGLTTEQALRIRAAIDKNHRISGEPGEKPRLKLVAQAKT